MSELSELLCDGVNRRGGEAHASGGHINSEQYYAVAEWEKWTIQGS